MKLSITQEDIDKGQPSRKSKCAVALAFTRATGYPCCVYMNSDGAYIEIDGVGRRTTLFEDTREEGHLDEVGTRFVRLFDLDPELCMPVVIDVGFNFDDSILARDHVEPAPVLADLLPFKRIEPRALPQDYVHV